MKIIGMGNALVDFIVELKSDQTLAELGLPKGSMQLINKEIREDIMNHIKHLKSSFATGGSASNTLTAIAQLGTKSGFIGKIGEDEDGKFYQDDLIKRGVTPYLLTGNLPSGKAIAFISPDGERTFATYLGSAATLAADELQASLFQGYDIFHIEGYLVQDYALIEKAIRLAKSAGCLISIDLASYNVVEEHLDFLRKLIQDYVDILFANEEEARAFTHKEPEEAIKEFATLTQIAVIKTGAKGSLAVCHDQLVEVSAMPARCIDTNGAGDGYAAGFLYGISQNASLEVSAQLGTLVASNVIETIGTKLDKECWVKVNKQAQEYLSNNSSSNGIINLLHQ